MSESLVSLLFQDNDARVEFLKHSSVLIVYGTPGTRHSILAQSFTHGVKNKHGQNMVLVQL